MIMYSIKYSKQAIKVLRKLPKNVSTKICNKIGELATSPYSHSQVKNLKGVNAYRLRVGDWRIIYTVEDQALEVWIVKVASRGEVYKS